MTTPTNPTARPPKEDHWSELTATLSAERTEELAHWLDRELEKMEQQLESYVTVDSLRRSLRRSRS